MEAYVLSVHSQPHQIYSRVRLCLQAPEASVSHVLQLRKGNESSLDPGSGLLCVIANRVQSSLYVYLYLIPASQMLMYAAFLFSLGCMALVS